MSAIKTLEGHCLCGAVTLRAAINHSQVGACHCATCRRWGGGPLLAIESDQPVAFDGAQQISVYASSDWAERGFCKECGTHLFYRLLDQPFYAIPVGLFDDQQDWQLTRKVFIDQRPEFYCFAQRTEQLTGDELFALHGSD
jgi:hypothetical protein